MRLWLWNYDDVVCLRLTPIWYLGIYSRLTTRAVLKSILCCYQRESSHRKTTVASLLMNVSVVSSYIKDTIDQGSQTRGPRAACGPPVHFMRPLNWSCSNKRMWPTSVPNNLFFILRFFCHGPKMLKKVCYSSSWSSIAVISLSGNTKETISPERIQEYSREFFCYERSSSNDSRTYGTGIYFLLFLSRQTLRRLQKICKWS
jgi:hypothetical protein